MLHTPIWKKSHKAVCYAPIGIVSMLFIISFIWKIINAHRETLSTVD